MSEIDNESSDEGVEGSDMNMVLHACAASYKTKKFAIVQNDWTSLKLDASENQRAAKIVHSAPNRSALYSVTVDGVRHKHEIDGGGVHIASVRRYH
jgi:hypothetical protein